MKYRIPRGTFDIFPKDSARWHHVIDTFRRVAERFGYEEITTPIFEMAALFERSSGESSDVVQKEMYRFEDQKGRAFALRPEGTAGVVRAYVENHLDRLGGRSKFYYIGPMFRYDRPQAGRYRQFYQYGVEFLGSNHPYYDAEVIALEMMFLAELGLKNVSLEINSLGCAQCSLDYDEALRAYYQPHLAELCPDCQTRFELNPRRLLDCKVPFCRGLKKQAPSQLDYLDQDCKEHFTEVQNYLDQMGIKYLVNPSIVRGLDYYTNTAFELIVEALGAQDSIAGGGRYNGLISQFGGKDTAAVGFAGGFERLLLALEKEGIEGYEPTNPTIFVIGIGDTTRLMAIEYITKLRQDGIYVDYNPDKNSFKAQMKAADASNAGYALIIGEDELASGKPTLKDLESSEQHSVDYQELLDILKR